MIIDRLKLLKELSEVDGAPGNEKEATRVMKKYVEKVATVTYDNLGSLIATKAGSAEGPKIMLAGHIDEIGFLVKEIDKEGFIKLHPLGGWWPHVLLSQVMTITTKEGKKITAIVGSTPPHGMPPEIRKNVLELKNIYLDLGVDSKEEVEKLGVQVGDPVTPYTEFRVMNNPKYIMGKAWDNRISAAIVVEVLNNLKNEKHPNTVYGCGTVQEEVGLRGAKTASYTIKPDVSLAIDVTIAKDLPVGDRGDVKLGSGVALSLMDASVIAHKGLLDYLENLCKELNIAYTFDILSAGGTDSGEIHKTLDGVVAMTLSIPSRYIHSHTSMVHLDDYEATIKLVTEFVKRLDFKELDKIKATKH